MREQLEHATLLHLPCRRGQYAMFTGSLPISFLSVGTGGGSKERPSSPASALARRPFFGRLAMNRPLQDILPVVFKLQEEPYQDTNSEKQPDHYQAPSRASSIAPRSEVNSSSSGCSSGSSSGCSSSGSTSFSSPGSLFKVPPIDRQLRQSVKLMP